jgi:hypothetical protein
MAGLPQAYLGVRVKKAGTAKSYRLFVYANEN